jgi:hypothetical protein
MPFFFSNFEERKQRDFLIIGSVNTVRTKFQFHKFYKYSVTVSFQLQRGKIGFLLFSIIPSGPRMILSRVLVTIDGFWIGESIY